MPYSHGQMSPCHLVTNMLRYPIRALLPCKVSRWCTHRLVLDHPGAQRFGEAAVRHPDLALQELHDAAQARKAFIFAVEVLCADAALTQL